MLNDKKVICQVGFWSAIVTSAAIIVWVAVTAFNMLTPIPFWVNFTALLIAPAFVVLMAAVRANAEAENRLWTEIALAFAVIYALIVSQNYFIQMTVVRQNPAAFDLLSMDPTRKDSAFWAMEILGYGFMSLAAFFVSFAFRNRGIEQWIRWLFIINAFFAMTAAIGYVLTANPLHIVGLLSVGIWSVTFPAAAILLGIYFKRATVG